MVLVVGIDIAKMKFDAAYTDAKGKKHHAIFPNEAAGFRLLEKWLKTSATRYHLILEATGNYWRALAHWAQTKDWRVSVVNPLQTKAYAKSLGMRSKTDKLDAFMLARYGEKENPISWHPSSPEQNQLDNLLRQLRHIGKQISIERSRLASTQAHITPHIKRMIAYLEQEQQLLEVEIAQLINKNEALSEQAKLLLSIPGIGRKTLPHLLNFFADLSRFANSKKAVSMAGLAPLHHQSGSSICGKSRIGRAGHSGIRRALFMPAVAVGFGKHAKFSHYAQRLENNGKKRKIIVIALMRKLLTIAYAVLKSAQPFQAHKHACFE